MARMQRIAERRAALMETMQQRLGAKDWEVEWRGYVDRLLRPYEPWPWCSESEERYYVRHYDDDVLLNFLKYMGAPRPALPQLWWGHGRHD